MINITKEKTRLLHQYAQRYCDEPNPEYCSKSSCSCSKMAEYHAFRDAILPKGYRKYTIDDFTGEMQDGSFLDNEIAIKAKQQVCKYCYGTTDIIKLSKMSNAELREKSIVGQRMIQGNNIVIHGEPKKYFEKVNDSQNKVISEQQMGRTFTASLITKEALKLKITSEHHKKTFDWIDFSNLNQSLKNSDFEIHYYEECDWLVIDDITVNVLMSSPAQKSWIESVFNAFFANRYQKNLVTIFIFRFDINKRRSELESVFGVTLSKIIDDKSTFVIKLGD